MKYQSIVCKYMVLVIHIHQRSQYTENEVSFIFPLITQCNRLCLGKCGWLVGIESIPYPWVGCCPYCSAAFLWLLLYSWLCCAGTSHDPYAPGQMTYIKPTAQSPSIVKADPLCGDTRERVLLKCLCYEHVLKQHKTLLQTLTVFVDMGLVPMKPLILQLVSSTFLISMLRRENKRN